MFQDYPGNFCRKGWIEDHALLDKPFWAFVKVIITLEQNSMSVGKVECIWPGFGLANFFPLF